MEQDPSWQFLRQPPNLAPREDGKKYSSKRSCWVMDPTEGFVGARIKSSKGDLLVIVTEKGEERSLKREEIQEMNPPKFDKAEDMSNLTFLNDASVLHNLRQRYLSMLIYTFSGLFCVVINPYKKLPIYGENVIRMYIGKRRSEVPPHLFAIADEAYRNMTLDCENQSLLITGESGAGKTENTKRVIGYFATIGATQAHKEDQVHKASLEEQIVQTNPVLEAFGNAKTARNNNSSRFGKFIRVYFDGSGKLAGGDIDHYLLEKSRVIKQANGERSFHIFYQILSAGIDSLIEKLFLTNDVKAYRNICQAEIAIEGVDDKEEMLATDKAFDIMNFEPEEKENLYKLCAAILHMGNMKFKQRPRQEQAEADGTDSAEFACRLMGVDSEEFLKALLKPRVKVGLELVNKCQNLDQVTWSVGALCKAVYARMFHWLIGRCNKTLEHAEVNKKFFIGVLDIAGFEIFDFNSFEQLWINFVNEKLQQFFNHHMFVLEQELYKAEGIAWDFIDFGLDLQACIELIEKPLGIVSMLDEECIVPKATDQTLVQKLNDQHLGKHPHFQKAKPPKGKQSVAHFSIVHYAGTVRYNATGWLEKNKDPLNDTVIGVLKAAKGNDLTATIWKDHFTAEESTKTKTKIDFGKKKGKAASFLTVSMMYRESLNNLMAMLRTTHPHFIRCIIPNEAKQSGVIDAGLVLNQLTCNGVLEGIRICRKGYPNRVPYEEFVQRYSILRPEAPADKGSCVDKAKALLNTLIADDVLKVDNFQYGLTKIFFKTGIMALLEDLHNDAMAAVLLALQTAMRAYLAKADIHRRKAQNKAVLVVQNNVRKWLKLRHWCWYRLYGNVRPMLGRAKEEEMMQLKIAESEKAAKELNDQVDTLKLEKENLEKKLEVTECKVEELRSQLGKLSDDQKHLFDENEDLRETIENGSKKTMVVEKKLNEAQCEIEKFGNLKEQLECRLRVEEKERKNAEYSLQLAKDELTGQEMAQTNLLKEKRLLEESKATLESDLNTLREKLVGLTKAKGRLEQVLDETEESLEREKSGRQEAEKTRRKIDGELKITQETLEETNQIRHDLELNVKKKEDEISRLVSSLEEEHCLSDRLQKTVKDLQSQLEDLSQEIDMERDGRVKADRRRQELQAELENVISQLDEANGNVLAQQEMTKRREVEINKLKREKEDFQLSQESMHSSLQKRHADMVAELNEQIDTLQKEKSRSEKEKNVLQDELDELKSRLESETKARAYHEKICKQAEFQAADLLQNRDELAKQVQDMDVQRQRLVAENATLNMEIGTLQSELASVGHTKIRLTAQLDEASRSSAEEASKCQHFISEVKRIQCDLITATNQLEEEMEAKSELQKQLTKAKSDAQALKVKYEQELALKTEEAEEAKKILKSRTNSLHQELDNVCNKLASVEKVRNKLQVDLEEAHNEIEKANSISASLEKKHKIYDRAVEDWKQKCDELTNELDVCRRDSRALNAEMFQLRSQLEQSVDREEAARRECRNLTQELQDITTQLGIGGKTYFELQKLKHRLELEKEELQHSESEETACKTALEEAESALESEESKTMKVQAELTQTRQDAEQRIREKEEEIDEIRRSHSRTVESLSTSAETESKGRAELSKTKKKLESDIVRLEVALDHAHKANEDATRQLKRQQELVKQLQMQLDEEQKAQNEWQERYSMLDKRLHGTQMERDEVQLLMENSERNRRLLDHEVINLKEQLEETQMLLTAAMTSKRKWDIEMQTIQSDADDMRRESRDHEEKCRKAFADAVRLSDELRQEQEHSHYLEQKNKTLEQQLKDVQLVLEQSEVTSLKGNKKYIFKLEQKVRDYETDLGTLQRKYQEAEKLRRKSERLSKEAQVHVEELKKNEERMQELIERLNGKIKTYKCQADEAEQLAAANLTKYRQMQGQVQEAEERADLAENSLAKLRAKHRSQSNFVSMNNLKPMFPLTASSRELNVSSSNAQLNSDQFPGSKDQEEEEEDEEEEEEEDSSNSSKL